MKRKPASWMSSPRFDRQMQEQRSDEEKDTEERAEKLRQAMKELEQGLDDLKSRAYDNVSEQLQGL